MSARCDRLAVDDESPTRGAQNGLPKRTNGDGRKCAQRERRKDRGRPRPAEDPTPSHTLNCTVPA